MLWVLGWFVGSFICFFCFLKITKIVVGTVNCGDLVFFGTLAILSGPIGIGSVGLIYLTEKSSRLSSTKCKKITDFINKHV